MSKVLLIPVDRLAEQRWFDAVGDRIQQIVTWAYASAGKRGRQVQNILHGTWLGHPLHPVLTDTAIGFWTTALALDTLEALGADQVGPGADAAVALGVVAAVPTALAGATDWQHTDGGARRIGVVHGLLNLGGALLYGTSLLLRRRGARGAGRGLAFLSWGLLNVSAYLGGHVVYNEQIGVNHAAGQSPPDEWTPVLAEAELPENQPRRVEVAGVRVLLVRQRGWIHALAETCAHLGGPLAEGSLEDGSIRCPWHGSRYALADGHVLDGPSAFTQPCFETRVNAGQIEVRKAQR